MTAYSFGNRWVGIVSLREPAQPEPLHRLAARLRTKLATRVTVSIGRDVVFPKDFQARVRRAVRRHELHGNTRIVEQLEYLGRQVAQGVSLVLSQEQAAFLNPVFSTTTRTDDEVRLGTQSASRARGRQQPATGPLPGVASVAQPSDRARATDWGTAMSAGPVLGPVEPFHPGAVAVLEALGIPWDAPSNRSWLDLGRMHRSFVQENHSVARVSPHVLTLLESVGTAWLAVAIVDTTRDLHGEFDGPASVSNAAKAISSVRVAWGRALHDAGMVLVGRGERGRQAPGVLSSVGAQVLGAACLIAGGPGPANVVARDHLGDAASALIDWNALAQKAAKGSMAVEVTTDGPAHHQVFSTSVNADGKWAAATATSKKASRSGAMEAWVRKWAPAAASRPTARRTAAPQLPTLLPRTTEAVGSRLMTEFELPRRAAPMVLQAMLHSSWTHENRTTVNDADQRSYETLAAEGSHVLHALRTHQQAVSVLNSTLEPSADDVRVLTPDQADVAQLGAALGLPAGVLTGRGLRSNVVPERFVADSAQAVIAAAWRAAPAALTVRQPMTVADWVADVDPRNDPITLLTAHLLGPLGLHPEVTWEARGASHAEEYRATWAWPGASWVGSWRTSKRKAEHSLASEVLRLVFAFDDNELPALDSATAKVLASIITAAITRLEDPHASPRHRAIARSRIAMSAAVAGAVGEQANWAEQAERVLAAAGFDRAAVQGWGTRLRTLYLEARSVEQLSRLAEFVEHQHTALMAVEDWHGPVAALLTLAEYLEALDATLTVQSARLTESSLGQLIPLDGLKDSTVAVSAGAAAVLDRLISMVTSVARASESTVEVDASFAGDAVTVTLRVAGVHLGDTLDQAIDAAHAIVRNLDLGTASGAVSVVIPAADGGVNGLLTMVDAWDLNSTAKARMARVRGALDDLFDCVTDPSDDPDMDDIRSQIGAVRRACWS